MSMNNVKELFLNFVEEWRKRFNSMSTEERQRVTNLDQFSSPCQLEVIWLRSKQLDLDFQLWIVTHFENEPDVEVFIHGPIESEDAQEALATIPELTRYNRPLPEEARYIGVKSYRGLIEGHVLGLIREFRRAAVHQIWSSVHPQPAVQMKQWLSPDAFVWVLRGSPETVDYKTIIENIVSEARRVVGAQQPTQPKPEAKEKTKGFGTYIYPHVWIGSRPVPSFKQQIADQMYDAMRFTIRPSKPVFATQINNTYVLATNDGFVAIGLQDRSQAIRAMNTFMALLTLEGIPAFAVSDGELGDVTLDEKGIGQLNMAIVLPRMQPLHPLLAMQRWELELMSVVEIKKVERLWHDALDAFKDDTLTTLLGIFEEVYTHFQRGEYAQTVLLAWIFVEKWSNSLQSQLKKEASPDIADSRRQIYSVFEFLPFLKQIGYADKSLVDELKRLSHLRSSVIHRFTAVTKEQAESALLIVLRLLKNLSELTSRSGSNEALH
jgi:hypothetical protein